MTVLTDAYAMNLTLAIPSLNRCGDENPPPLDLPSFDEILRFGILTRAAAAPSELYRRFLWQGSLLDAAKQKSGIAAEQAAVFAGLATDGDAPSQRHRRSIYPDSDR